MGELITISGVRGYVDENGTAQLNLEDVARGLGFTQIKNGVEYVRWETVECYLECFGLSQQVGKTEFIPENVFYRLAMKAKNETAEAFQVKVADEILPAIRKTGIYAVQPSSVEDLIIMQAKSVKELKAEVANVRKLVSSHQEALTTVNHRINSLDAVNTDGDLRQRLNHMVHKYAWDRGVMFNVAWREFKQAYNTAYHTNIELLIINFEKRTGLKNVTTPAYLAATGKLADAIRVADKLLNKQTA